jgi:hypothetical protein
LGKAYVLGIRLRPLIGRILRKDVEEESAGKRSGGTFAEASFQCALRGGAVKVEERFLFLRPPDSERRWNSQIFRLVAGVGEEEGGGCFSVCDLGDEFVSALGVTPEGRIPISVGMRF